MISFSDLKRLIHPLRRKIFLLIGRAVLTAIDNSEKTMKIQVTSLKDETITDIERFENYGLTSYPKVDSEVLITFIDGNRDQGIAVVVHDRENRPSGLSEGDVYLYNTDGLKVTLDSQGITVDGSAASGAVAITLKTGDASSWVPNTLVNDPFTGLSHGGAPAGIVKLKGG